MCLGLPISYALGRDDAAALRHDVRHTDADATHRGCRRLATPLPVRAGGECDGRQGRRAERLRPRVVSHWRGGDRLLRVVRLRATIFTARDATTVPPAAPVATDVTAHDAAPPPPMHPSETPSTADAAQASIIASVPPRPRARPASALCASRLATGAPTGAPTVSATAASAVTPHSIAASAFAAAAVVSAPLMATTPAHGVRAAAPHIVTAAARLRWGAA